jgi:hypothetical protein
MIVCYVRPWIGEAVPLTILSTAAHTVPARGGRKAPPALAPKAGLHAQETSLSSYQPLQPCRTEVVPQIIKPFLYLPDKGLVRMLSSSSSPNVWLSTLIASLISSESKPFRANLL